MSVLDGPMVSVSSFLQRHFLWLLLGSYAAAALMPGPGLWIKDVSFGRIYLFAQETPVTLPMLMLALLLLNAGLGIRLSSLKGLPRIWLVALAGVAANLLVPVFIIMGTTPVMGLWLEPEEVRSILLGLALVACMPIAASSTAWSQNVGGDTLLSLGLLVLSTLLSPLTTPATLQVLGSLATEGYAENLRRLSAHGAGLFLMICVVAPSLVGVLLFWTIGESRLAAARPRLKLLNWIILLLLIYANASVSLPDAIAYPDIDFLLTSLGSAVALCVLAFGSGWLVARLLGADPAQQTSLMFGLGMNNNGAGLVLASAALANPSRVLLPIIAYNLAQHLFAGTVAFLVVRKDRGRKAGKSPAACDLAPTRPRDGSLIMKWITRERVKVDRVACPWLIRKFVDPQAEFLFVPEETVVEAAQRQGAIPYDVKGVELGHHGKECSFDAIVKKHGLASDPGLVLLAKIVNGADTDNSPWNQPESAGLKAVAEGFRHLGFKDDHALNAAEWIVYDALYAYCEEMVRLGKPNGAFAE